MARSIIFTLYLATLLGTSAFAGAGSATAAEPDPPPFMRQLYPPELVMRHQRAIALTDDQRDAITTAIKQIQGSFVEIQWKVRETEEKVEGLFREKPIPEEAALDQVGELLDLERQVKTQHLRLLIRIRNTLTDEQIERLKDIQFGW